VRYDAELSARVEWAEKVTVLFATGGNDALVTLATGEHWVALETYIENMRYFIRDAKSRGYQPVCIGLSTSDESKLNPIPWDTDTALRMTDVSLYDESLKTLAESEGALYIPMRDVFENQLDLLVDGDHPGPEGHRRMYVRVKEYLEKAGIL
jgi:lysophospholipase L1-like esterase